jgi:DNA-binding PadR family transcriptional regulator
MTEAMYYVLLTLVHPNHGYQLMTSINEISNGRITMGPGTLYGILTRMQKEKLIRILKDDGRRKTYKITDAGLAALHEEHDRLRNMVEDGRFLRGDI